jgi:hypothetical protein
LYPSVFRSAIPRIPKPSLIPGNDLIIEHVGPGSSPKSRDVFVFFVSNRVRSGFFTVKFAQNKILMKMRSLEACFHRCLALEKHDRPT